MGRDAVPGRAPCPRSARPASAPSLPPPQRDIVEVDVAAGTSGRVVASVPEAHGTGTLQSAAGHSPAAPCRSACSPASPPPRCRACAGPCHVPLRLSLSLPPPRRARPPLQRRQGVARGQPAGGAHARAVAGRPARPAVPPRPRQQVGAALGWGAVALGQGCRGAHSWRVCARVGRMAHSTPRRPLPPAASCAR